jgi:2-oxoglutarate dehydrogenase E1 component
VAEQLRGFRNLREVRWVQDEPANMGPLPFMIVNLRPRLDAPFTGISRPASSAPSVGSHSRHLAELAELMQQAFA